MDQLDTASCGLKRGSSMGRTVFDTFRLVRISVTIVAPTNAKPRGRETDATVHR